MEQDSVVTMSSLEIQNQRLTYEQCAAVFYSKTVHLGDMDFIEVDRQMLEILGFNNTFIEKNDKHGNVKVDKQGNPVLSDKRHDFSNAIRSLRNTVGFVEGKSFDDLQCHFIIQKAAVPSTAVNRRNGGAGLNKQSVWVRKGILQKWVQMNEVKGFTKKQTSNGLVYFIHMDNNTNVFKIGYTTNLTSRLEVLQTGNPYLLTVYRTIENVPRKLEARLHRHFHKHRIRGEWFAITPDKIDSVCKQNLKVQTKKKN